MGNVSNGLRAPADSLRRKTLCLLSTVAKRSVKIFTDALGGAEEEEALWAQGVVEERQHLLLQCGIHIDQQVAAADQVDPGERWIPDHVLLGEDQHIADGLVDVIGAVPLGEETGQALRGDVGRDAVGIDAGAGGLDGLAVDVGSEDLGLVTPLHPLHLLAEEDGDGVGLLAGGATGHPDPHGLAGRFFQQAGDDLFLQGLEGLRVAEEVGHGDQEIPEERLHLQRVLPQVTDVDVHVTDLVDGHASLDAAADGGLLVVGEIVSYLGPEQDEDLLQRAGVLGLGDRYPPPPHPVGRAAT